MNFIKERVWNKVQGLKEKLQSQAGKEALATKQAIPTFAISCCKLLVDLFHDIKKIIRSFWRGQRVNRRKIHKKKWEDLCQLKSVRGLGLRDLCKFNDAMLTNQVWRFMTDTYPLSTRSLKQNIFQTKLSLMLSLMRNPNEVPMTGGVFSELERWSHLDLGGELQTGLKFRFIMTVGYLVKAVEKNLPIPSSIHKDAIVPALIYRDLGWWNSNLIDNSFLLFEAQKIKAIPLPATVQDDHFPGYGIKMALMWLKQVISFCATKRVGIQLLPQYMNLQNISRLVFGKWKSQIR